MALATSSIILPLVLVLVLVLHNVVVEAQVEGTSLKLMNEWPTTTSVHSSYPFGYESDEVEDESERDATTITNSERRSLFWHRMRYYISYGALSANRIPCPPRSGRSYYTHNCYRARGPVHPYSRGCSAITRCRR